MLLPNFSSLKMCVAYFPFTTAREQCVSGLSLQLLQVLTGHFFKSLLCLHGQSTDHDTTVQNLSNLHNFLNTSFWINYCITVSNTEFRTAALVKTKAHIRVSKYLLKREPEKQSPQLGSEMHCTVMHPFLGKEYQLLKKKNQSSIDCMTWMQYRVSTWLELSVFVCQC